MSIRTRIHATSNRLPHRLKVIIKHLLIVTACIVILQIIEHIAHIYIMKYGTELAVGSFASRLFILSQEDIELGDEVAENVEEVSNA